MTETMTRDILNIDRSYFFNRELSWLKFNERVLEEAESGRNPLGERLNFLSIFQSNLDEFFMVRVGTLVDTLKNGVTDDKTGLTSAEQIAAVLSRTGELLTRRDEVYKLAMKELGDYGVEISRVGSLKDKTQSYLEKYFTSDVLPLLSPQIIGRKQPFPFLRNKAIYAVAKLTTKNGSERLGIVPCGDAVLRRLVPLQGEGLRFVLMEELIKQFLPKVFEHYKVENAVLIRVVRNADLDVDEADDVDGMSAEDYRRSMEKLIRRRTRQSPVRLDYAGKLDDEMRASLCQYLNLSKKNLFQSSIPLDLSFTGFLRDVLRDKTELFYPRRVPQNSVNVDPAMPMTEQIRKGDILLAYPYESIRPLDRLLHEAGQDPEVVSIKMTLYRVAHNSKIVEALVDAAENGKEVVVLVELRARFDEENNIGWSRVLERAGCRVIYGLDGMKVHSKLLLITRKHGEEIEYITQIGTGNYNEDTVKVYSDFALMTASKEIGAEAARVFNCLSMGEVVEDTEHLLVAPKCLRDRIIAMIDGEIEEAREGRPAYLGFKLNGLTDKGIIEKLAEASQAGVKIDLLIRGICCLIPGVPAVTDNINVYSIVGRFLEHARVYIVGEGERRRVYISSADFMTRNTMHRVEVAAPIYDGNIRERLETMFFDQLRDTVKLRRQDPDGIYNYVTGPGEPFNAQEYFYDAAYSGAWRMGRAEDIQPEEIPVEEQPIWEPESVPEESESTPEESAGATKESENLPEESESIPEKATGTPEKSASVRRTPAQANSLGSAFGRLLSKLKGGEK